MPVQLPIAFGFGSLAMLGWLAAAAAPLLIHLWSRHRFREVQWAAVQFLLAAMRKNARRLQLQQWLLLAVRTLLIVLVVLAVAEPYGESTVASGPSSAPTHKVLVIDGSFSTAYDASRAGADPMAPGDRVSVDGTRFSRIQQLAGELVQQSSPGDTFTLISMAAPARTLLSREVVDHAAVVDQIATLPKTDTGGDLAGALALVDQELKRSANDPRGHKRQEVYFFTDLQRLTWGPAADTAAVPLPEPAAGNLRIQSDMGTIAAKASLVIVDVGEPRAPNAAVTNLTVEAPFVTVGQETTIVATLRQFGDEPRGGCVIDLLVDGEPVGEQTIDLSAGDEAIVRFNQRFDSPGSHVIQVRSMSDGLIVDNRRWLVLPVRERVRVLCVAGREGAANYIARALAPNPAQAGTIEPVVVTEGDLAELAIEQFDCVFLCNIAQLTDSEAARLTTYVEGGGGLVFFLGDRTVSTQFDAIVKKEGPVSSLFPVRVGRIASTADFGIDPLDYRHPIVAPFRGRERAGLLTTPISRYFQLDIPTDAKNIEVAAALRGGHPLIVTSPVGRGRSVIVATDGALSSIDAATGEPWTTWPTWPSFLPIVRELLAYASGGRHDEMQYLAGATLGGRYELPGGESEFGNLQIARPDGSAGPVRIENTPDGKRWSYSETNWSGVYTLRGAPQDATSQFAVNVATVESDLTKVDAKHLPKELNVRDTWRGAGRIAAAGLIGSLSWDRVLLWLALALIFSESLLAWHFGRGAA